MASWSKLVRFTDLAGNIHFGEPTDDFSHAKVWEGISLFSLARTDRVERIAALLPPYQPDSILCIGLNYLDHAKECNRPIPSYPVLFYKPKLTVNGPFSDVVVPQHCKSLDYENELCVVMARDAKDVAESDAIDYILGYTVGNDVSSREWQQQERSGGQFSFAKSCDGFLPFGPAIVSARLVPDPQNLALVTRVNGEVVQDGSTCNMIFSVAKIISFLSQGTTIPAGALIMTGTPAGVAAFKTSPPVWLRNGDVVECAISGIGFIKNKMVTQ
ncbi:Fumarylacetoacetase-like protein [Eremomyces bilateralis CBS 781.70]|uniref:Fumarylacetoacetase-like protein n=1 Tax=Eremomyces bilateralis CBS 781.70 TaxID=1392243 RepID=A0A6G1G3C9_9PEZI|nr:Fumarylacetoacetase-like protein [Eremomyces bilateralis CBS 781.70]KAF1812564.1 Fumarylacetoacetase-like protein [Eremomyces bilateralis CBS 781.70]